MQFAPLRRRQSRENIVPMINVVFLLLIFFLMTARIAPPDPFEITPPDSAGEDTAPAPAVLYVAADGSLAYAAARGEAVFDALAGRERDAALLIRADRRARAQDLARLLARLAGIGVSDVSLVTGGLR